MANVYPTATGAWSSRTWNDCATGSGYVNVTPQVGDTVYANGTTLTIDVSVSVAGFSTGTNGSASTGGGVFSVSAAVTISVAGDIQAVTTTCLSCNNTSGTTVTINGGAGTCNIKGSAGTASAHGLTLINTGTVNITGNVLGGGTTTAYGVNNNTTGRVNVTGNITGGSGATTAHGLNNVSTGQVTCTGTVTGSATTTAAGINNPAAGNLSSLNNVTGGAAGPGVSSVGGTVAINGTALGSGAHFGLTYTGSATVTVNNATGGSAAGIHGIFNNSTTGSLTITGTITGGTATSGSSSANGVFLNSSSGVTVNGNVTANGLNPGIAGGLAVTIGKVYVAAGVTLTNVSGNGSDATMAIQASKIALAGAVSWIFAKQAASAVTSGNVTLGAGGVAMTFFSGN